MSNKGNDSENLDTVVEENFDETKSEIEEDKDNIDDLINEIIDKEESLLEQEVSKMRKENKDLIEKLQRSMAEFDNFRKRTAKEKSQMYDAGVSDTLEKLLPVIDNFERAVSAFENKDDAIYKGFEMILKQLHSFLNELGVEIIKSVGEQFDTNFHFAVAHIEDGNYSENEVIEELQKGYIYKDKVIRFSMVKVAN